LFKGVGAVTATRLTQAINADSNVNKNVNSDVNSNINNNTFEPLLAPSFAKKSPQLKSLHTTLTKASQAESVEIVIERILAFYIPVLKTIEENWRERSEDFRVLKNLATEYDSLDKFLENLALDPPNDSVATAGEPEKSRLFIVPKGLNGQWCLSILSSMV